jgi:hypothetical protein
MTKTKKSKINQNDALRMRVITLKSKFPSRYDYTPIYEYVFGKQTKKELDRIRAVWNLREVDKKITENLETISLNLPE